MSHRLHRRDLLATLAGLPVALTSCSARNDHLPPAGEIVGAAHHVGHRLRNGPPPRPAEDQWEQADVVIVGGGVAGLTAAWRSIRAGFRDFTLLELESAPGGTSRSGTSTLVDFPWGAHYLPAPMRENRPLIRLLEEMDLVEGCDSEGDPEIAEQFLCRDPQERLFHKGRWYEDLYLHAGATTEDLRQLAKFQREIDHWIQWRDAQGRRAFAIPMSAASDDSEVTALDSVTMAQWLAERGLNSPRLQWLVDYACRDDYGLTLEQTSAWAGIFYFAARTRTAGAASRPFITWPEGNGRLIKHLYAAAKPHVRLGWAAADIQHAEGDAASGIDIAGFDTKRDAIRGIHTQQVVFAVPHYMTRHLIRSYESSVPSHVGEFEYGPWMVANLFLHDRPAGDGFPLAWENVLYDSPSLGYVTATHQKGLDFGPTILTYYHAFCDKDSRAARQRLLDSTWADCAEMALADLSQAHGNIRSLVDRLDVMRWGHAMIRPRVGFVWSRARQIASKPWRGIHFAHSDLSGLPLFEEAFAHGVRAAEEVLRARNVSFQPLG